MPAATTTAESAKKESEVRQLSAGADEKRDYYKLPVSTPQPGEPQLAFREEAAVRLKSVGDEAKAKSILADLAPVKPQPARPAVEPPVDALALGSAPAAPSPRNIPRDFAVADSKDAGVITTSNEAGKTAALNETQRLNEQPTPASGNAPGQQTSLAAMPQAPELTAANVARYYSRSPASLNQTANKARNRFSQVQSTGPAVARGQSSGAGANVLAEFDLEQTGNRVRVVDADGSVYDGLILEDAVTANFGQSPVAPSRRGVTQNAELQKAATRQVVPPEAAAAEPAMWNFRANGTNRTLQQAVTINGVLYAGVTNTLGQMTPLQRGLKQQAQQSSNASLPSVQRIQGRFQIGGGAEKELDAVRSGN
jgi:hypothetical protein